ESPLRTREELEAWLGRLDPKAKVAVAFAFRDAEHGATGDGLSRTLCGFGFADGARAASVEIEQPTQTKDLVRSLVRVFTSEEPPKAVHNSKLLRLQISKLGLA